MVLAIYVELAFLKLLKKFWWRFPPLLSHMHWAIKILQPFPKGQGVFLKSSLAPTKSAGYCIEAGEGLGISGLKFTFFALEFIQKRAEVRLQQFELASQQKCLSLLKKAVSHPSLKGSCIALTCWDVTSASHVSPAVAAEVAETHTRAVPWAAAPWGHLGSHWENSCLQQSEQSWWHSAELSSPTSSFWLGVLNLLF